MNAVTAPSENADAQRRSLVLIGASNVTINLPDIWKGLTTGGPTRLIVAAGHGRSFGMASTALGRTLPGILDCQIWEHLSKSEIANTPTLITDVGNDLLYGASVERIAKWVDDAVSRLNSLGCRVAMTRLPIDSLCQLSPQRFQFFRRLFFPSSLLTFDEAMESSRALDCEVQRIANSASIPLLSPEPEWYGLDPIHFRRSKRASAWSHYLSSVDQTFQARKQFPIASTSLWLKKPAERIRKAKRLETPQPVIDHAGSQLWLF